MKKLFGTDGIRDVAGRFPLDRETMRVAGRSLAEHLAGHLNRAPRVVTGRDTRQSGEWIEAAFAEGVRAAGGACESAGVITTPGVAYLARTLPADAGVVVSASHNPYADNGIKIFAPTGRKLDDATERLIEADIYETQGSTTAGPAVVATTDFGARIFSPLVEGHARNEQGAAKLRQRYMDYLADEIASDLRLDGWQMVVDCANGAAWQIAPELFRHLGAEVEAFGVAPNGRNINFECGSLYVERLCEKVVGAGAQLGVAFDGDADRALFVDARGQIVDGDATLWVLAQMLDNGGRLAADCVVATVMSNIGLELALEARGLSLVRTDVGDKYVLEELLRGGASLGGEQSGHIILPQISLAGDGLLTALSILRAMRESGKALHELTAGFVRYPQVLVNVPVRVKRPFREVAAIDAQARHTEELLSGRGRLLLRYSGTEPLARVMIEGPGQDEIESLAENLAVVIREYLGSE
ncbi:MAG: phosphoglucosamine mutase [Pyrinomonadaceae bacterium]|nr:phosphoglucosamine mutase [Pyrinomonadaceae bacterium]